MNPASRNQIIGWFKQSKREGATHMIVMCDDFDFSDYPVNVMPGEDAREKASEYRNKSMQRVMEVYDLNMDLDFQMSEHRALHY